MDISKEAAPSEFIKAVLPILQQNGVVHFLGLGNRLGFDSVPVHLQRLRCRCSFHALKFVPQIQQAGSLLVQCLLLAGAMQTEMDKQLFGSNMLDVPALAAGDGAGGPSRYLALHMRFEEDMVTYSLCVFGGGDAEREELQAYRETHFPTLAMRLRNTYVSVLRLDLLQRTRSPAWSLTRMATPPWRAFVCGLVGVAGGAAQPGTVPADARGSRAHAHGARLRPRDVHLRHRVQIYGGAAPPPIDAPLPQPGHQGGRPLLRRASSVQELLLPASGDGLHRVLLGRRTRGDGLRQPAVVAGVGVPSLPREGEVADAAPEPEQVSADP